jgi:hypothetical protein
MDQAALAMQNHWGGVSRALKTTPGVPAPRGEASGPIAST